MNSGQIFSLSIYGFVALIMAAIGVYQLRSKKPATFYSGEKQLKPEQLTSVDDWNRGHGLMWIGYGLVIILSALPFALNAGKWTVLLMTAGVMVPIPFLVMLHERMLKKYKINEKKPDQIDSKL